MSSTGIGRRILGIVIGLFTAAIIVAIVEAIGFRLFPLPAGFSTASPDSLRDLIMAMSVPAKATVLAAWFLGALIGGWAASTIARWRPAAWIVPVVILLSAIWTMVMIPHPAWMMVVGLALPILAAFLLSRQPQDG